MIISRTIAMRSAREEHVLGADQADALGAELARLGARPPACRRWRARPASGSDRPRPGTPGTAPDSSGSTSWMASMMTSPVAPFERDHVALAHRPAARLEESAAPRRPRRRPRPRRTACPAHRHHRRVRRPAAARRSRCPAAAYMPATSSGDVSGAHQDHLAAFLGPLHRPVGVEDDLRPRPPPGAAASPRASRRSARDGALALAAVERAARAA